MDYLLRAQPRRARAGRRARAPPATTSSAPRASTSIVIGGGDTGADCVGNAHREGAASVTQLELLGEPPRHAARRADAVAALADEAAHVATRSRRAASGDFAITTTALRGQRPRRAASTGRRTRASRRSSRSTGTDERDARAARAARDGLPGTGSPVLLSDLGLELHARSNVRRRARANRYTTNRARAVSAAGDCPARTEPHRLGDQRRPRCRARRSTAGWLRSVTVTSPKTTLIGGRNSAGTWPSQ